MTPRFPASPGDPSFRPFVSERPDVTTVQLDGTEDFLLLACDGFFDVIDAEQTVRLVMTDMAEHPGTGRAGCTVWSVRYGMYRVRNVQSLLKVPMHG